MEHPAVTRLATCLAICFAFAVLAFTGAALAAPEEPAADTAPVEMEAYQLVLLKRPANRPELPEERVAEIQKAHMAHLERLALEGRIVAAGPFGDQDDPAMRGLALYRVGSVEEARRLAEEDPAVQAGRLEVEVMTWYTAKGWVVFPKAPEAAPQR